jgi:signal transduction histidine kinase
VDVASLTELADERRRQLDEAQAIAHIGSWAWDAATDSISCSDEWYRIFGVEPQSRRIDLGTFLRLIHPGDRTDMLDAVGGGGGEGRGGFWSLPPFSVPPPPPPPPPPLPSPPPPPPPGRGFLRHHRVLDPDGTTRWIEGRCDVVAVNGEPARMVGTSYDITERRRYEESLRASIAEVRASRARLVAAADAERRRVERDLHDGAQQRLVALAMTLRLAQQRLGADADPELRATLAAASAELRHALAELRDLARGLHPAMLSEQGLGPALEALALRTPLPVRIAACPRGRLPEGVEVAIYYLVAEALTNTLKHACAARAEIEIQLLGDVALVRVRDDGVGGASSRGDGGLRGLADRVAAAGGRLDVDSPRGGGTTISAELPCA